MPARSLCVETGQGDAREGRCHRVSQASGTGMSRLAYNLVALSPRRVCSGVTETTGLVMEPRPAWNGGGTVGVERSYAGRTGQAGQVGAWPAALGTVVGQLGQATDVGTPPHPIRGIHPLLALQKQKGFCGDQIHLRLHRMSRQEAPSFNNEPLTVNGGHSETEDSVCPSPHGGFAASPPEKGPTEMQRSISYTVLS